MPKLTDITIQDFRNLPLQQIAFSTNVNCIWGSNGEGKTNLLDAIHYLSMGKAQTTTSDKFNFRQTEHPATSFAICGNYELDTEKHARIAVQVSADGGKILKKDDKAYKKISEHIGLIPVVMVSPYDSAMISESGEERRRFLNSVISQMDCSYLAGLQRYNRLLQQRNTLLKTASPDQTLLDVIDAGMGECASEINIKRQQFTDSLLPVVQSYYRQISGGREQIDISYSSDVSEYPLEVILAKCRQRDLLMKFTTAGIQRDDLIFTMNGFPIRRCGSQGQQKSFLVALKFAQYELMDSPCRYHPILLLDDLFDKLDLSRVQNLLEMVSSESFGQIFITDTDKSRILGTVDSVTKDRAYFEAKSGFISRTDE